MRRIRRTKNHVYEIVTVNQRGIPRGVYVMVDERESTERKFRTLAEAHDWIDQDIRRNGE